MDYLHKEKLETAINNMSVGTAIAARLKTSASDPDVKELAKAVHFIGYGAQQAALAIKD
ncbi:hypothetical protein [Gardnerella vaginalis]|uniref:hypothetical protein n=1 Tax=Gardnerella vaginalis TaxID=2702 RepID=UPI0039F0F81F